MIDANAAEMRLALAPLALLFRGVVGARNRLFDRGILASTPLPVPVISVGNITVGGTGKTPLVAAIASRLEQEGHRVAVLSRGYGGTLAGRTLVLSEGRGGGVLAAGAEIAGDEPVLLARQLPRVAVVVGADRRETGRIACERLGAGVLLLDDGFQHRWVRRDLDIVVLDCLDPFGRYRMLPAGTLREPLSAMSRAGMFVVTRSAPGDRLETLEAVVRKFNTEAPIIRAFHRPLSWVPLSGMAAREEMAIETLAGRGALAFCAIGNPEAFRSDLSLLGIRLTGFESFRDHHPYSRADLARLLQTARDTGAEYLITTEKDAVRLPPSGNEMPVCALRIRCEIEPEKPFFGRIEDVIAARAASVSGAGARER